MINTNSHAGFTGLGIAPLLLEVVNALRFKLPTPIQAKSIPIGMAGQDLIAIAQTGTGKTLAFGIPMIQRLSKIKGRILVLLPTRELALQVDEALHPFAAKMHQLTAVLIGGESIEFQQRALKKHPRIIIATPGRLIDMIEQRRIALSDIEILVLDEADRMLDMGFAPQINKILALVPKQRQTMLFSATMPREIVAIAQRHMQLPVQVEIAPPGTTAERVNQEVFFVGRDAKTRLLEVILRDTPGPVLVFTRTKHGARRLARQLRNIGHGAAEIHSDRTQGQRRSALDGFKSGRYSILVATDIAARGIDVTGIELVVNYDLPTNSEDYVHRIGRTARAGRAGRAISFATLDQAVEVKKIERLIRAALPVSKLPQLPPDRSAPRSDSQPARAARASQPPDSRSEQRRFPSSPPASPSHYDKTMQRRQKPFRRRRF